MLFHVLLLFSSILPNIQLYGWQLRYVDSQEVALENGHATNAFDNNPMSYWQTERTGGAHPHEIQIDMRRVHQLAGITYLPRQDGKLDGIIARYEIYVSLDGNNWGKAVATGVFSADTQKKIVPFPKAFARYIRLRSLSSHQGGSSASAAEIDVVHYNCAYGI